MGTFDNYECEEQMSLFDMGIDVEEEKAKVINTPKPRNSRGGGTDYTMTIA